MKHTIFEQKLKFYNIDMIEIIWVGGGGGAPLDEIYKFEIIRLAHPPILIFSFSETGEKKSKRK